MKNPAIKNHKLPQIDIALTKKQCRQIRTLADKHGYTLKAGEPHFKFAFCFDPHDWSENMRVTILPEKNTLAMIKAYKQMLKGRK